MKTTIEVNGFEIKIEELEGKITVVAEKDGEVMEEFELEAGEEVAGEEGEEMMPFGDEEEDSDGDQDAEGDVDSECPVPRERGREPATEERADSDHSTDR